MSTSLGIRNISVKAADQPNGTTVAAQITGLSAHLVAGEKIKFRFLIPFTTGGVSGVAFVASPTAVPSFGWLATKIFNCVAGHAALDNAEIVAEADTVQGALLNAGNALAEIEGIFYAGVAPMDVNITFAQVVADATPIIVLAGAVLEVVYL